MKYVAFEFESKNVKELGYLPITEFCDYVGDEVIKAYAEYENPTADYETVRQEFMQDLINNYNSYAPQNNNDCTCTIVKTFHDCVIPVRRDDIDNFRLDFAEYALDNYLNPVPTLEKISQSINNNKKLPLRYLISEEAINDMRREKGVYIANVLQSANEQYEQVLDIEASRSR